tara:strand:- start:1035 stop:1265 length:231 start_codon:yes stop_codon:yes gene_type:complete
VAEGCIAAGVLVWAICSICGTVGNVLEKGSVSVSIGLGALDESILFDCTGEVKESEVVPEAGTFSKLAPEDTLLLI